MEKLLEEIKACTICAATLPLGPRPVVTASANSRIMIIGQAPGLKVHQSGVPWDDASGKTLREWLGISDQIFYDPHYTALIPMGFCYPGKGKSGDLPPRPECAPAWHDLLLSEIEKPALTLLIGQYAQKYYLKNKKAKNLTETVRQYKEYLPHYFPLPHPSPRNRIWMKKNQWFTDKVLPKLKAEVRQALER